MIFGVLGVGHLASAIIAGLLRSGLSPNSFLLSPRGRANLLSARDGIPIAGDNRDLVTRSDFVLVSVRPADAPAAVVGLPWRADQVVISVCAGVPRSQLQTSPAHTVRAMPFTAAEIGASPTVYFPDSADVRAILERIGPAMPLMDEADFEVATVCAAVYGWAQELIRSTANWSVEKGVSRQVARQLAALTFVAAGRLIAEKPESMDQLLAELVTPGGITELGLKTLAAGEHSATWRRACEAVLNRLK
jgi:pyrroline-5-carboxylate reductase